MSPWLRRVRAILAVTVLAVIALALEAGKRWIETP